MAYKWTFMVYIAGDNGRVFDDGQQLMHNLEGYGWDDIREMSSVGSTDDVAIIVQYDTLDAHETPRFYIDGKTNTGTVVETVPPVNTGDPKNLTDFIVWAEEMYPAEQYALILWNHGTGWKEEDIYARYRKAKETVKRDNLTRGPSRKRMLKRSLFLPTAAQIMSLEDDEVRGICYDDTSMDFLDNQGLAEAFAKAEQQTGNRLAVLGMDACLMSMIEVAYQIHSHADFMVSSQEVEKGTGWPYATILQELVATPDMSASNLSKLVVQKFGDYYMSHGRGGGGKNTQSAVDLGVVPQTFDLIKKAAQRITEVYGEDFKTELAVSRAYRDAQTFNDKDYVDLRHLMMCMRDEYDGKLETGELADALAQHLELGEGPIIANFHGYGSKNAHGLSIYFPGKQYSPFYDKQAFALSSWGHVIRQVNGTKAPNLETLGTPFDTKSSVGSDVRWIDCPICGGSMEVPLNISEVGETIVTRNVRDLLTHIADVIQEALTSPATANQWLDIPCLHCQHTFQYNAETGAARR